MKTYVKVVLFFVFFIVVSAILAALYFYNLKHTDMSKAHPDFVITATALLKEFEDNETSASAKYVNKILEVDGIIGSINTAKDNILTISLRTESDLSSVICTFPAVADPSKFRAGDSITLRGECSGFLMDVLLNNCAAVNLKVK
jgi:hypothetical protein